MLINLELHDLVHHYPKLSLSTSMGCPSFFNAMLCRHKKALDFIMEVIITIEHCNAVAVEFVLCSHSELVLFKGSEMAKATLWCCEV